MMAIEIEQMTVCLSKCPILQDITLTLEEGKVTMLLGANGAGKTTLLKAILGLIPLEKGTVAYNGKKWPAAPSFRFSPAERAKIMAYVPQHTSPLLRYTVEEFVLMGITPYLGWRNTPAKDHIQRMQSILTDMDLLPLARRSMDTLSGGERQRAYLARAMMQDTPFLLLDEPTASLDYARQHLFLEQLARMVAQSGKGGILTIHDPNLALQYGERFVFLHKGRLLGITSRDEADFPSRFEQLARIVYSPRIALTKAADAEGEPYIIYWKL